MDNNFWTILWDKCGDFVVTAAIGIAGWFGHKLYSIDRRFTAIELNIATNYVTNQEFTALSNKLDHSMELLTNKVDNVNNNILILIKDKVS